MLLVLISFMFLSSFIAKPKLYDVFFAEKISAHMVTKTLKHGLSTTITADVFYLSDGKMVTHFINPKEFILFQNGLGELKMYDPLANSVMIDQNPVYSSESSNFYYFFSTDGNNLGLKKMGFTNTSTRFEDGLMITVWTGPASVAKELTSVELAFEGTKPIYLGYQDRNFKTVKKIFFYDFLKVGGIDFPASITEINYVTENDSIISKTTYSDFKVDDQVDLKYINYKIPDNANAE